MKLVLRLGVLLLLLPLVFGVAHAKVSVSTRTKAFTITGKTGKQIYQQIRNKRPAHMRKLKAIGLTRAKIKYKNVRFQSKGNRCVATNVDIQLLVTYYYPRWDKRKGSSRLLQKRWNAFEKELHRHEHYHGKIYRNFATALEKEFRKISAPATRGCKLAIAKAKKKAQALKKSAEARQAAFDRRERRKTSKIKRLEIALYKTK